MKRIVLTGGEKKKQEVGGREMTQLDTKDGDNIESGVRSEEEFYRQVEEKLGFTPVKMGYLPQNTCFDSADIHEDMQTAQIQYFCNEKIYFLFGFPHQFQSFSFLFAFIRIYLLHEASFAIDTKDFNIREYEKKVAETAIRIKEYSVDGSNNNRYSAEFIYKNNYYLMTGTIEKVLY